MRGIELFCGEAGLYPSEKAVLTELIRQLSLRGEDAIIFSNFTMGHRQIDLFVATATTTLQIEVKGYRNRIEGDVNGKWQATDRNGMKIDRRNAFGQARENNWAMRDAMNKLLRRESPYPRGAVVFSPVIPAGSVFSEALRKHPHVSIIGQNDIGKLLNGVRRSVWSLEDVRKLALDANLTRCASIDEMASKSGMEDADDDHLDADQETRSPTSVHQGRSTRGKLRLLALAAILALLAFLPFYKWFANDEKPPALPVTRADTGTPATTKAVSQKMRHAKSIEPASARPGAPLAAPSEHPAARPAAPINCPANVDRLGCNGRVGIFDAPQCPAGFHIDGESCAPG